MTDYAALNAAYVRRFQPDQFGQSLLGISTGEPCTSVGRIRWLIGFRPLAGCEKGTADLASRDKEGKLGNAAQLSAHFGASPIDKKPRKRRIRM
jgi:hypothetical protein